MRPESRLEARFGPLIADLGVTFRFWAPAAETVAMVTDRSLPMEARPGGWFELAVPTAGVGTRYKFRIDDEIEVPDPASRFQPDDVHGASEVIAPDYHWAADTWKGRPWHECVLLELHVGALTPQGTFRSIIDRLDHIVDTGFTAIELMPVADFSGRWNWGYDGVLPFAPDSAYGRPEDLKTLIDAAHRRGLMVFLDVVYNHFGPDGNYLGRYAPQFFTKAQTPWGSAIDYRVAEVRAFAIENALHWLGEYRFDGLRLDAVHAITEPGEPSVLTELSAAVGALAAATGRHIHLVLENDDNCSGLLDPACDPPQGLYRAQWNDDYHHAWHVALTGETTGYYRDYHNARCYIARCLSEGFAYQGESSAHRNGTQRGEPSTDLPATAFVNFLQNHDQIGNRARGERLSALASPRALEAALAITLLAPAPPLLFMGEEWGATEPFPFFCDFTGNLADAVRQGRRREFAEAYAFSKDIPDPLSEATLQLAKIDWQARDRSPHRERLDLVRRLLAIRKIVIHPLLPALVPGKAQAWWNVDLLHAHWRFRDGTTMRLIANLGDREAPRPLEAGGVAFWPGAPPAHLSPWSVYGLLEAA